MSQISNPETDTGKDPDREALARLGTVVRERLAADPSVYKVPVDQAEIYAVSDFLSAAECERLIAMIDAVAKPSELFDEVFIERYRTSYSGDVDRASSFVRMIERRISDTLGIPLEWGESVQGQRYRPGEEFKEHCDWFDTGAAYFAREIPRGGQRSWTAMVFLNAVEEGGETHFTAVGARVEPQPGLLLAWNNAAPDGAVNPYTMHAATPVVRGVKHVITKWFRTRPWN